MSDFDPNEYIDGLVPRHKRTGEPVSGLTRARVRIVIRPTSLVLPGGVLVQREGDEPVETIVARRNLDAIRELVRTDEQAAEEKRIENTLYSKRAKFIAGGGRDADWAKHLPGEWEEEHGYSLPPVLSLEVLDEVPSEAEELRRAHREARMLAPTVDPEVEALRAEVAALRAQLVKGDKSVKAAEKAATKASG